MGIIDTIKEKVPSTGVPKAGIEPSDFPDTNDSREGEENQEGSKNGSGSEESEKGSENGSSSEESEKGSENGSGSEESEEESENGSGSEESEEESEEYSESQGSTRNPRNLSSEELENMKKSMSESSAERDMSEWTGSEEMGFDSSKFINQYYKQLQEERAEPETEMGRRRNDRDERIESLCVSADANLVREKYEERFADEISEAFRKIKTREAPSPAEYGQRINMRGVVRRRSGDPTEERLYLEMNPSEAGDRCITVVVDSSGSMDGLEIKLALLALADATEQIGDRFAATTYDTETTSFSDKKFNARTQLITAPTEDFEDKHLNSFKDHGYTPTATGIKDGRSISDITPNSEDVIIVITDGVANIDQEGRKRNNDNYQNPAMKEAGEQVATAINEGKRVIGLGVGEYLSDEAMSEIFGNNYFRADMDEISDTLVEIYRRQMETA